MGLDAENSPLPIIDAGNGDEGPDVDLQLVNYPPNGSTGELRQLVLGGPGPLVLLVVVGGDPDANKLSVDITMSGIAENEDVKVGLTELCNMLVESVNASGFSEAWHARLLELAASDGTDQSDLNEQFGDPAISRLDRLDGVGN